MKITFRMFRPNPSIRKKKLAEVSVEFLEGFLKGLRLIGFTVNENEEGLFVLFPSYIHKKGEATSIFHFLRPMEPNALDTLENKILDEYERQLDEAIAV